MNIYEHYSEKLRDEIHSILFNSFPMISGEMVVVEEDTYKNTLKKIEELPRKYGIPGRDYLLYSYRENAETESSLRTESAIKIVLILEAPFKELPLYINSHVGIISALSKWRLKKGL